MSLHYLVKDKVGISVTKNIFRGVATGGVYRYIYPQISNHFVHVWGINICFEIVMTS